MKLKLIRKMMSVCSVFLMIAVGFVGILVFEGVVDEGSVEAVTLYVGSGQTYSTIQSAIDASFPGYTISVLPGTYVENLVIDHSLILKGSGASTTTIDGDYNTENVISINADWVEVTGFTIAYSGTLYSGIELISASNCTISNNKILDNSWGVHSDSSSKNNKIEQNTLEDNTWGITLDESESNTIIGNTFKNNGDSVDIRFAGNNIISFNICIDGGSISGLGMTDSIIMNNTCNSNFNGIDLFASGRNTISGNTCNSNDNNGIILLQSYRNKVENNICNLNGENGIKLEGDDQPPKRYSLYNIIRGNNVSNNKIGINLDSVSDDNRIFYNNIISNQNQATDDGNNYWNNSNPGGNYWSDYIGKDDGSGKKIHAIEGDGIGDTKLPHAKVDRYPYVKPSGWLHPTIPVFSGPTGFDSDGDYNLTWFSNNRTNSFILEEDDNSSFPSPTVLFEGNILKFNVAGKTDGNYYYRLKAVNEHNESNWSKIKEVIVDFPPDIPQQLKASAYPEGNAINISWVPNLLDTKKYELQCVINDTWIVISTIKQPFHTYNHTNLTNEKSFAYRICAIDHRDQPSEFSAVVGAVPMDTKAPATPRNLSFDMVSHNFIYVSWKPNTELDLAGYNIYRSKESDTTTWGEPLVTKDKGIEVHMDTWISENITYYYVVTAFDEVPNESDYSEVISITAPLSPRPPQINNTISDFEIIEDGYDDTTINLHHLFKDVNNDPLIFYCKHHENIQVILYQENGTVYLKPEENWNGQLTLNFIVSDDTFQTSTNVTITVTSVNDPPGIPEILSPIEGSETNFTNLSEFQASCSDPDVPYGDKLTYSWSSDLSGLLGTGETLTNFYLKPGKHMITVEVYDELGKWSKNSVQITVLETPSTDWDLDGMPDSWERMHGLDIKDPTDANFDLDNDGLLNLRELELNTDPTNPDTDSDGHVDGSDLFPLDSKKWGIGEKESDSKDILSSWMLLPIIIVIIIVVVVLITLLIMKGKTRSQPPGATTYPQTPTQPHSQAPPQYPQQQSPQHSQQPPVQHQPPTQNQPQQQSKPQAPTQHPLAQPPVQQPPQPPAQQPKSQVTPPLTPQTSNLTPDQAPTQPIPTPQSATTQPLMTQCPLCQQQIAEYSNPCQHCSGKLEWG